MSDDKKPDFPPSLFGSLFGDGGIFDCTSERHLARLWAAQQYLDACDRAELELLRSQPLSPLVN